MKPAFAFFLEISFHGHEASLRVKMPSLVEMPSRDTTHAFALFLEIRSFHGHETSLRVKRQFGVLHRMLKIAYSYNTISYKQNRKRGFSTATALSAKVVGSVPLVGNSRYRRKAVREKEERCAKTNT